MHAINQSPCEWFVVCDFHWLHRQIDSSPQKLVRKQVTSMTLWRQALHVCTCAVKLGEFPTHQVVWNPTKPSYLWLVFCFMAKNFIWVILHRLLKEPPWELRAFSGSKLHPLLYEKRPRRRASIGIDYGPIPTRKLACFSFLASYSVWTDQKWVIRCASGWYIGRAFSVTRLHVHHATVGKAFLLHCFLVQAMLPTRDLQKATPLSVREESNAPW